MYNLLCKGLPWENGRGSVLLERLFEYTEDNVKAQFQGGDGILYEELRKLPCLFMREGTSNTQLAHVGEITQVRKDGAEISIDYSFASAIKPIPNSVIFGKKFDFGMSDRWEFSRTHWAVKDIDLFRTLLSVSMPLRKGPKVFTVSENEDIDSTLASTMMPFGADFDVVYREIEKAVQNVGMESRRADQIWESSAIIQDIVALIDKSFVVICDCTKKNSNVFYEIGIAHTLGREVILITQNSEDVPFDLGHIRHIKYLNNGEGLDALRSNLENRLGQLRRNL